MVKNSGKLAKGAKSKDVAYYTGQVKTCDFFCNCILPITHGKMNAILTTNSAAVEMEDDCFGGK